MMRKAWYILNYHDISWEDGAFTRAIGGTFPPDIFEGHVTALKKHFRLVSVQQGLKELEEGISEPIVSFWFDDGFLGVRKNAQPILERHGVTGASSINSSFLLRQEFFWRLKLGYLTQVDGMRFIRSGLRKLGISFSGNIRGLVMDNFSDEVLELIDRVFIDHSSAAIRDDAWRLFDDVEGTRALLNSDWVIANHSASHYPVSETSFSHQFAAQFQECEGALNSSLGINTDFWVMPFDRGPKSRATDLDATIATANPGSRHMVFVGNGLNHSAEKHNKKLYRINVPYLPGAELIGYLEGL
jgi:hypothetical protein